MSSKSLATMSGADAVRQLTGPQKSAILLMSMGTERAASVLREMRDEGATLLVSTHDLAGVGELCDEAILLHRRVLAHGSPDRVLVPELMLRAFGLEEPA